MEFPAQLETRTPTNLRNFPVLDLILFAAAQVTCYYLCKLALSSLDQTSHRKKAGKLPDFVEARLARGNHKLNEYELVVGTNPLYSCALATNVSRNCLTLVCRTMWIAELQHWLFL
jgi:hypothetical protein